MVEGVLQGFTKELEIQGVGFKGAVQGRKAVFMLGYSTPVELDIPAGIDIKVTESVNIVVSGPDKQRVGDFAAHIRSYYRPNHTKARGSDIRASMSGVRSERRWRKLMKLKTRLEYRKRRHQRLRKKVIGTPNGRGCASALAINTCMYNLWMTLPP